MTWHPQHKVERFCVVGVSYQKADIAVRSRFSLDERATDALMAKAKSRGITSLVVLNTCNRVEIYGYVQGAGVLAELLLEQCPGAGNDLLNRYGYLLNGLEAFRHLFRVGAGLESQILGDFEIVGQLKDALRKSAACKLVGPLMDRTFAHVFQASKKIKNETHLSKGTASVSFAVVDWLNRQMDTAGKKMLLIGAGAFGKTVLKNIRTYCPLAEVSLTNRTPARALDICREWDARFVPFELLPEVVHGYDVVVCCTNAPVPFIGKSFFKPGKLQWVIDLSVPSNVREEVKHLEFLKFANVDEISALVNNTLHLRQAEVPKAIRIIEEYLSAYLSWLDHFTHATVVAGFRQNLLSLKDKIPFEKANASSPNFTGGSAWEKGVNARAGHLMKSFRKCPDKGCQVILAYDSFIQSQMARVVHD